MSDEPVRESVEASIKSTCASHVDRLDVQLLLCAVMQRPRTWLLAHGEAVLDASQRSRFAGLLTRRAAGEPLAYLLGHKEFHGLDLQVDARVLVPRPETELLVDWAGELIGAAALRSGRCDVVDLGTGSGAIALALKHAHPQARVSATDASADALAVATANAARLGLDIEFRRGDWWMAVDSQRFDIALSNPPYVAREDAHLRALRHEPIDALSPGPVGLEALQTLVAGAASHLREGGWLLLEHGFDQANAVRELFARHGFEAAATRTDLAGLDRCTGARRIGRSP